MKERTVAAKYMGPAKGRLDLAASIGKATALVLGALIASLVANAAVADTSVGGGFNGSIGYGNYQASGGATELSVGWTDSASHTKHFYDSQCDCASEYGQGTAQAQFGLLKGDVNSSVYTHNGGTRSEMDTTLYFVDQLLITNSGKLRFSISLHDALYISPGAAGTCAVANIPLNNTFEGGSCALAASELKITSAGMPDNWLRLEDSTTPGGNGVGTQSNFTVDVSAGQHVTLEGYLRLNANACSVQTGPDPVCVAGTGDADASAEAGYFVDALDGASSGAGSGHGYGSPAAGVPEPGTWAMMLLGIGSAGTILRRRRSSSPPSLGVL